MIHRTAETAHRLILPDGIPYTMTLFSTGPTRRDWGFWLEQGDRFVWRSHKDCIQDLPDGRSIFREPVQ